MCWADFKTAEENQKLFLYNQTSKFDAEYGFAIKFSTFSFAFQINH